MLLDLYDAEGDRKYLTIEEREAFLKAAEDATREVRKFCGGSLYMGCRISEALALLLTALTQPRRLRERFWVSATVNAARLNKMLK